MRVVGAVPPVVGASLAVVAACALAGCGHNGSASAGIDGPPPESGPPNESIAAPYRHTITLDGNDDFTADETFATTSTAFTARLAWDDTHLYVGYSGPDFDKNVTNGNTKWLFVYVDTVAGGEAQSEMYNTQRATFPSGFGADYYARYKVNGTLTSLKKAEAGAWVDATPVPLVAQQGTYVELAIPLTSINAGSQLGVVTWMINEKMLSEGSYAGLYMDNFTEGYAANLALGAYLEADFTSSRAPNDLTARRP